MTRPRTAEAEQLFAAAGIPSSPEGRERAKIRLADAAAELTPERREQLRQLGRAAA